MTCYYPLPAFRSAEVNPETGKRQIAWSPRSGYADLPIEVPCGQCIGCKLDRSRQWALRCHHEASLYDDNCFLTLTYNDLNLPSNGSLDVRHHQLFMKRLRKKIGRVRFFHCGEYGEKGGRPHYHYILFGHDFEDKVFHNVSGENRVYTSATLERLWPYGFSLIGGVTFESAAYVARYCLKKITGEQATEHYQGRRPEYATMSNGIGAEWLEKFHRDVYPKDFVTRDGIKMKPSRYYDELMEKWDPELMRRVRAERPVEHVLRKSEDRRSRRLRVREIVQDERAKLLKRGVEEEDD